MGRCLDCDYMRIKSAYHGDDHDCMHPSCFEDTIKENKCCEYRALYGIYTKRSNDRIRNFEEMNCNNDCEFFKVKRSIWDRIFLRD